MLVTNSLCSKNWKLEARWSDSDFEIADIENMEQQDELEENLELQEINQQ